MNLFPLNWTLVHPITEGSPLYKKNTSEINKLETEIIVLIQGFDETFSQSVHVNSSYTCAEILSDRKFAPMYYAQNGTTVLELDRLDETIAIDAHKKNHASG